MKSSNWMHCLASFKLYVFSRSCRVFHFCCYSFNLWLPYVFPNAGEAASCAPEGWWTTFRSWKLFKISTTNTCKMYTRFFYLCWSICNSLKKHVQAIHVFVWLFVCLFVFVEVLSVSPISLNASAIRRRTRAALESLADSWLGWIPRAMCAACCLAALLGQAKRLWQKVGLQPEEMMAKHSINIPLFLGEGKLETSAASVETFVYHSSMVSWQRLKFGSAGRLFSCCWAEPYPREAVKHLFGAGIERDLLTIRIYMWHWMYDVWTSMLQLASACFLDTY